MFVSALVLATFTGCNQPQPQTNEPEQKEEVQDKGPKEVEENINLTGKISVRPEQHMIDVPQGYPYSDYFDTDKIQYVIYSKEKINCSGEFTLKGSMIEIEGGSKRPGSDEVYTEKQILVDSYECPTVSTGSLVTDEYKTKIVYNMSEDVEMMKSDCEIRRGKFNECGSPCAPDAEMCVMMCAFTCELGVTSWPNIPGDESKEWKDYTSEDMGLSLQYPYDMSYDEEAGQVSFQLWGPTQKPDTEFYDGISINFYKKPLNGSTLEDIVAAEKEEGMLVAESISEPESVTLGGVNGYKFDVVSMGEYTNYYLPLDDSNCLLMSVMVSDPAEQGFYPIADKILGSLRINTL